MPKKEKGRKLHTQAQYNKIYTETAVCTLFEGNYHYGVGALVNSLYAHGYRGIIWAGYRGKLPEWARPLAGAGRYFREFVVGEGCCIRFVDLADISIHLNNYKPQFMLSLLNEYCSNTEKLFYFDPDIVIKCRWSFYENWVEYGIALCQDCCYPHMPANHPLRMGMKEFAKKYGHTYNARNDINQYFNAGFIGIKRDYTSILTTWNSLMQYLMKCGIPLSGIKQGDRSRVFFIPDQDTLNLAVVFTPHPLSVVGPEGMDFEPAGFTMSHAVLTPKPWQKRFMMSALGGTAPTLAEKEYWKHTETPVRLFSKVKLFRKKTDLFCGAAIGRFIKRR